MNSTSQTPKSKFPFSSGNKPMDNRTLYLTLVASTTFGLAFVLGIYAAGGLNPAKRLDYGLLVSVPPALGALLVVKLTRVFDSWRGAFMVYLALFVLAMIIQAFSRSIEIYLASL